MFTFVSKSFCPSAFKRHFLSPIGNKKAHRPCINFSSTSKRSVYRFLYPLFQNHFLLVRLIRRIPQPWGQYQQNGKQTYCRLPPQSFRITLKDTPSHISMKSWGFYLSKIFLEFFSNMYIPPWLQMVLMVLKLLANTYVSQSKNWVFSFFVMLPSKTFPQVLMITPPPLPSRRKLLISPEQPFLGIYYGAQRMTKIKRARILSQVLINSTIFATFIFLVSVFCHNLDSIMLK